MSEGEPLTIGDYQLVNCIATGNFSQVWEVQQVSTSQMFAMKLLLEEALADAEQRNTLKHEAKVGKSLQHPNIIQILDSKISRKQAYIVMELFKAPNLKLTIRGSLISVHSRMSKLAESVTSAFAYMHEKGWIHKDIKPENILMTKASEVRVIDFSLASKPGSTIGHMVTKKSNIQIQGTRTYIAPELIKREKLTPKADIYSLGITFYECLTGRPPFTGTNPNALLMSHIQERPPAPSEFHKNITPQADSFIARLLSKKPADRHESMQEVLSELRNLKFFKLDPQEFEKQEQAAAAQAKEATLDQRLDSRSDHEYTRKHGNKPVTQKTQSRPEPAPAKRSAAPPSQPAAQAPQPPPQQMPWGMPPQMYPGMMPPGMPGYPQMPPGMMPPGYPQMPPGMLPPGMPGYPQMPPGMPQPMPPQGVPPSPPQPSGQPLPTQPGSIPPAPSTPPPPSPPPTPAPQEPEPEPELPDDIDWLNVS